MIASRSFSGVTARSFAGELEEPVGIVVQVDPATS